MAQSRGQDPAVALALSSGKVTPAQVAEAEGLVAKMRDIGVQRDVLGALVDRKVIAAKQADAFREAAAKAAEPAKPHSERIKIAATNDADPARAAAAAPGRDDSRPTCANHPTVYAVNQCSYCGKSICKDCVIRTEKGYYCSEECMAGSKSGKPARAATGAEAHLQKAVQLGRKLSIVGAVIVLIAVVWILKYVVDDFRFSGAMRAATIPGVQLETAVVHFRRAAELNPTNAEARHLYGRTLARLGEVGTAVKELEAAAKLAPDDPAVTRDLAEAYEKKGSYPEARTAFLKLRTLGAADSASEISLGTICQDHLGEMDDAVDAFNRAITVGSEAREIRYRIGRALMSLGKFKDARVQFAKSVEPLGPGATGKAASREKVFLATAPKVAAVHSALAELAQKENDMPAALASIAKAQSVLPSSFAIVEARAKLLKEAGKEDEILSAVRESQSALAANADYLDKLAALQEEQCTGDEALRTLRKLKAVQPLRDGLVERLIKAEAAHGSAKQAHVLLSSLGQKRSLSDEFVPVWIAIVKQELTRGQPKEAERLLTLLGDLAERDTRFAALWCESLHRQGRDAEALERAEVAVRKNPRSPAPHLVIGSVLRSMGRTRDALKRFRTAATLGARGAAEMETGLLMWDAGLNEDASRCFANALEAPDLSQQSRFAVQRYLNRMRGPDLGLTRYSEPMEFINGQLMEASTEPGNLMRQIHLASCGVTRAYALIAGTIGLDPIGGEIDNLRGIDYADEALRKPTVFVDIRTEYDRAVKACAEAVRSLMPESGARAVEEELREYARNSTNAVSVLDQIAAAGLAQAKIVAIMLENHDRKAHIGAQARTIMDRMHARILAAPGAFQRAIATDCALVELGELAIAGGSDAAAFRMATATIVSHFATTVDAAPDPLAQFCMSRMAAFKVLRILCRQVLEAGSAMKSGGDEATSVAGSIESAGGA